MSGSTMDRNQINAVIVIGDFYGYILFQRNQNLSRYVFRDRKDSNNIYMHHLNATYC